MGLESLSYIDRLKKRKEYWFCGDLDNGHMEVKCMLCGENFESQHILPNAKEECPYCGNILDYPERASW